MYWNYMHDLDNLSEVKRISPIFKSEKITNLNTYRMGNLLFISFGISSQLSSFEKLIEYPEDIIAKEDFRIFCGSKMLFFPKGSSIIQWSSTTTQTVEGNTDTIVFIH